MHWIIPARQLVCYADCASYQKSKLSSPTTMSMAPILITHLQGEVVGRGELDTMLETSNSLLLGDWLSA